jgi:hypothetical protein
MATQEQARAFINSIGPMIQSYGGLNGYKVVSTIIAQACLESAYGTSSLCNYHNYFGMKCGSSWKGASVNRKTFEEYAPGVSTEIRDNFRVYNSMDAGVEGYFNFIGSKRYQNLKTARNYREYAQMLKDDGYATSSKYVAALCSIVEKYNLVTYDITENQAATARVTPARKIYPALARNNAFAGKYVTTANLHLRVGPGTKYDSIEVMSAGTVVHNYGYYTNVSGTNWYYVKLDNGILGHCSSKYLRRA